MENVSEGETMSRIGIISLQLVSLAVVLAMVTSPISTVVVGDSDRMSLSRKGEGPVGVTYVPILMNFTLDTFDEFLAAEDESSNLSLMGSEGGDGSLRLSTGFPDISILGSYTDSEAIYAETLTIRAGAYLLPSDSDRIEIYARNVVMKSGSVIYISGTGNTPQGRGSDGEEATSTTHSGNTYWYGGGGGGGGAGYGGNGGKGGTGGGHSVYRGRGGDKGLQNGEPDDFVISSGAKGGGGGKSNSSGGIGGMGGGVVKIVAENIFMNGTVRCEGEGGGTSANAPQSTGGGGGGGSGGGILISGRNIEFGKAALFSVKGGSGGGTGNAINQWRSSGGGGGGGAGGRIKVFREHPVKGRENLTMETGGGAGGEPWPEGGSYRGATGEVGKSGNYTFNQRSFTNPLEYLSPGVYLSKPFDTNTLRPHFDHINVISGKPQGSTVAAYTQTAHDDPDSPGNPGDWNSWSGPHSGSVEEISSTDRRWIRIKIVMEPSGENPYESPDLHKLVVTYHTDEEPSDLSLDIVPTIVNPALGESATISIEFQDPDNESGSVFSGLCKLRDNTTMQELILVNGTFAESDLVDIEKTADYHYRLNISVVPGEYEWDGEWNVHFELYDGMTDRKVLNYGQLEKYLSIGTNHVPEIVSGSVSVSENLLPIVGRYSTLITFGIRDEDPHTIEAFRFTIKLRANEEEIEVVSGKTVSEETALKLMEARGDFRLRYEFDPGPDIPEGKYELFIGVEDDRGAVDSMDFSESDIRLDLRMNSPPSHPGWILPRETGELTPRISWERATDPDGDALVYSIRIGTQPDGDDILRKTSTGTNNFYDITIPLSNGDYHVQVWSFDTVFFSPVHQEGLRIDENINIPPRPPTSIMPNYTKEVNPLIKWTGAFDRNDDELTYFIQIGTTAGGDDVLEKVSTGSANYYQVDVDLLRGSDYHVVVWAYDGKVESAPIEEVVSILTQGNHRAEPPTAIFPDITGEMKPTIFWTKGLDADGDELTYYIRIGTTPGAGDILPWTSTGTMTSYAVRNDLLFATYFVQVKCNDGSLDSLVIEETLEVLAVGNIPPTPPVSIDPYFTVKRYPDISWEGATDENEDDRNLLVYYIQIGNQPDGNGLLAWQLTTRPYYNVTTFLPDGIYYVQVMTSDGKVNSSVHQHKLYVGKFKPGITLLPSEITIERGRIYEFRVNLTNYGTIPDRMKLDIPDIEGLDIEAKNGSIDLENLYVTPGETMEVSFTMAVLNSFVSGEIHLNISLVSLSGTMAQATLHLAGEKEEEESLVSRMYRGAWFWPLLIIVLLFLVVLVIFVVRRRGRYEPEDHEFTEKVETKKEHTPIKKKTAGEVTRISKTPIMDPRAKRIAMAIYGAEQAQLSPKRKKDLPALPESTRHLPNIMVPNVAVGSSVSKRVMELKALPVASVVADIDSRAPVSRGSVPAGKGGIPSKNIVGGDMVELTGRILAVQGKLLEFRQKGRDVTTAEKKLIETNRLLGENNPAELDRRLKEIDEMLAAMDRADGMSVSLPADFETHVPTTPVKQPGAVRSPPKGKEPPAPASIPPLTEPPAPPGPPEDLPPPEEKKDVFSDLQSMLDGMK